VAPAQRVGCGEHGDDDGGKGGYESVHDTLLG
jgi:hypothetical protein